VAEIERPKSLTEAVLEHLRDRIVSGDFELGSSLSERQLAEELNVSKTPVREALAQLRSEGLVTILPQRGAYVFTLSAREVIEICEFRLAIESAALDLAIARNRAALVAEIAAVVDRMGEVRARGDVRAYLALDSAFHAAFFNHCGNKYLRDSYERYGGKIAALRTHLAVKPLHTQLSFEEHQALRDVFADGSRAEIVRILEAHIGRTREAYSEGVEDIAAADAIRNAG
jgi:DNA-binding GntR family transcriptional regulator